MEMFSSPAFEKIGKLAADVRTISELEQLGKKTKRK